MMEEAGGYVGDYELFERIGSGTFADVWEARHRITGCHVAVKRFRLTREAQGDCLQDAITSMEREIKIMSELDHPLIVELYEVIRKGDVVYLILENVDGGTLLEHINQEGPIDEQSAKFIFAQVLAVLSYLHHEKGVIHRDLKPENVMMDRYQNIRVIDFGFSNVVHQDNPVLYTACGSPEYVAPEMLLGQPYSQGADIWSAGVMLFAMMARYLPFEDAHLQRLVQKVIHDEPQYPVEMSRALTDLLQKMLKKDPEERITLEGIKAHPWFTMDQLGSCRYEFDAVNKYRTEQNGEIVVNEGVLARLKQFGVDPAGTVEMLKNHEQSQATVSYRILLKEDMIEQMAYLKEEMVVVQERGVMAQSSFWLNKQIPLGQIAKMKSISTGKPQGHNSMPIINKIPSRGPQGMQLVNLISPNVSGRLSVRTRPLKATVVVHRPRPMMPTGR